MPKESNPPIEEAIILAFVRAGETQLSLGDLSFLLRKKELKRPPTKDKKKKHKKWEKTFKDSQTKKWIYPLKQYDVTKGAIHYNIKEMVKDGALKRVKKEEYQLSPTFLLDMLRNYDIESIKNPVADNIILTDGGVRLYGFEFNKSKFETKYKKEFDKIIMKLNAAIAELFELNNRLAIQSYFEGIQEEKINENDLTSDQRLLHKLILGLFGKEHFENDEVEGLIPTKMIIDMEKLSKDMVRFGELKDIFQERHEENIDEKVEIFLDAISNSTKVITIHPIDIEKEYEVTFSKDNHGIDWETQWDVSDQKLFLSILSKVKSDERFNRMLNKKFDVNRDKWEKIPFPSIKIKIRKEGNSD